MDVVLDVRIYACVYACVYARMHVSMYTCASVRPNEAVDASKSFVCKPSIRRSPQVL